MYMYYFLGYQLKGNTELSEERKKVRAMNTFLLALDGDVDFSILNDVAAKSLLLVQTFLINL